MNLKTLGLASTVILFSGGTMLALQQKEPTGGPKSPQQSKVVPPPIPLEIKGDRIGETVAQFTAHYPNAKCKDETPVVKICSQTQNVSLAELTTDNASCDPPQTGTSWELICSAQGVHATFYKSQLRKLMYTFYGDSVEELCDAFALKYGKPELKLSSGCNWPAGQDNVGLNVVKIPGGNPKTVFDFVLTVVVLTDSSASKDI